MTSATVRLTWPLKDWPNPNRSRGQHWSKNGAQAKAIRTAAKLLALQALTKSKPLVPPVRMKLALAFPDRRARDLLNIDTKALIDGVVDSGLIVDDSWREMPHVLILHDPYKTKPGHVRVTVTITEIEEAA